MRSRCQRLYTKESRRDWPRIQAAPVSNQHLPKVCTPSTSENHMALAVLCIIGFIAYWVPTLAANSNRHRNRAAIGMLNLFLGWTVIGWVVALVWADTNNCEN